jgi:hypothetical protein
MILMFLFCPETSYQRVENPNIGFETDKQIGDIVIVPEKGEFNNSEKPWTFLEQLRPFRGIEYNEKFWKVLVRPFYFLLFPQIIYAYVVYAIAVGWTVTVYNLTALIFGTRPYNMSVTEIGLLGIGSLVSAILGFTAGPISDWLCKFMARRNNGIYEPEALFHSAFRLMIVSPRNDDSGARF